MNQRIQQPEDCISIARFAAAAGVTAQTIHKWRKGGKLQAVQLPNGRYVVPLSEVQRLLAPFVGGE